MPLSRSRAFLPRLAVILACAPTLLPVGGCHHRSSAIDERSRPERPTTEHRQQTGDVLQRFPGLDVTRTRSGGLSIRVLSGLVGKGEPLYVVDGIAVEVEPERGIDWIQPKDVVRIKVLKDPAETAVYGPRGVNGVIVITTNRAASQWK